MSSRSRTSTPRGVAQHRLVATLLALAVLAAACNVAAPGGSPATEPLRLYTSVTQDTVDSVTEAFGTRTPVSRSRSFAPPR